MTDKGIPVLIEDKQPLPAGWRWVRIDEVCQINPRRPDNLRRSDEAPTTFVPMSAIDERLGAIVRQEIRTFREVRRGYTYFGEEDVLFAKITPCMQNGKHAIARCLIDGLGFGTTEFHVLRPANQVMPEWIHFFLRQPRILQAATAHFSGAVGQQRVPEEFLANLEVPLPPLADQKRIVAVLSEQMEAVERARKAIEDELDHISRLPAAIFCRAFNGEL